MKYIKLFEKLSEEPAVGDYVICEDPDVDYRDLNEFLKFNIGELRKINHREDINYKYTVEFENIPYNLSSYFSDDSRSFRRAEITHFSNNKEDLNLIVVANKYNL